MRGIGRTRAALVLAVVSLVAAAVGSLGPADSIRTTFTWPPTSVPAETPARLWYTPLLLARQADRAQWMQTGVILLALAAGILGGIAATLVTLRWLP